MEPITTYTDGKATIKIYQDENPENPREWDNLGTMVCFHKRYSLGDKHDYNTDSFDSWDELKKHIEDDADGGIAVILPIRMYDHSGISLSLGNNYPYNCQWDSGNVGFIFVSGKKVREEYSVKKITKEIIQGVIKRLEGEIEAYNQYLNGDVYGFEVVKLVKCESCGNIEEEHIDSCWGFYGDSDGKENGMKDNISEEYHYLLDDKYKEE